MCEKFSGGTKTPKQTDKQKSLTVIDNCCETRWKTFLEIIVDFDKAIFSNG